MADFARILAALDHICGWTTLTDYTTAAADASHAVLEADPVAEAIRSLAIRNLTWQGTATELLAAVSPDRPPRGWPRTAHGLSSSLARLAPALRTDGIHVEFLRAGRDRRRLITIESEAGTVKPRNGASAASAASATPSEQDKRADASADAPRTL
jgi:hypothetical protein